MRRSSPRSGLDWAGSSLDLVQAPRAAAANKGNFGHVLVVGGTFGSAGGKAGAPAMAALAALRAGAGLVTAAVPAPALPVVASLVPELMTWPLEANPAGQVSEKNLASGQIAALIEGNATTLTRRTGWRGWWTAREAGRLQLAAKVLASVLQEERLLGVPLLVAANKQDAEGACSVQTIGELLGLERLATQDRHSCAVFGTSAVGGLGVQEGLAWLVAQMSLRSGFEAPAAQPP